MSLESINRRWGVRLALQTVLTVLTVFLLSLSSLRPTRHGPAPLVPLASAASTTFPPGKNSYLDQGSPDENKGATGELMVSSGGNVHRAVLYFDISTIPRNSTINNATLRLYVRTAPTASRTHEVYRLTRDWVEGEVTWNSAQTGVSWTTAGGDYSADIRGPWLVDVPYRQEIEHGLEQYPNVDQAIRDSGLDPLAFISAIIQIESSGNPEAVNSTSQAAGLMQVMPYTATAPMEELLTPDVGIAEGVRDLNDKLTRNDSALYGAMFDYSGGPRHMFQGRVVGWVSREAFEQAYWQRLLSVSGVATASTEATDGVWVEWDITSLVQGWHEGSYPNYGVLLKDSAEDDGPGPDTDVRFASREYNGTDPELVVQYTRPTSTPTHTNAPTITPTTTNAPTITPASTSATTSTPTRTPTSTPTGTRAATPTATMRPTGTPTQTPTPTSTPQPQERTGETPTPTEARLSQHIVERGDTCYSLTRRYGTTVEALIQVNGLDAACSIRAGQTLNIPVGHQTSDRPTSTPAPTNTRTATPTPVASSPTPTPLAEVLGVERAPATGVGVSPFLVSLWLGSLGSLLTVFGGLLRRLARYY